MKNVRIIRPKPKENKKLRVAAYCRVSTFGSAQLHSLDTQIEAYTRMIKNNKDWRFAGVFYDVESGLRRKGRTELDNMLKKAEIKAGTFSGDYNANLKKEISLPNIRVSWDICV